MAVKSENMSGSRRAVCVSPGSSGFQQPVAWQDRETVDVQGPIRICVNFRGVRSEDGKLYAVYVEEAG